MANVFSRLVECGCSRSRDIILAFMGFWGTGLSQKHVLIVSLVIWGFFSFVFDLNKYLWFAL